VQTIEITDQSEARRCRRAQYSGQKATMMLNGVPVTGVIIAVKEDELCTPTRWTVTLKRPFQRNG
jgi:hypothetical protein